MKISPYYIVGAKSSFLLKAAYLICTSIHDIWLRTQNSIMISHILNTKCFDGVARIRVEVHETILMIRCQPRFSVDWVLVELDFDEIPCVGIVMETMLS